MRIHGGRSRGEEGGHGSEIDAPGPHRRPLPAPCAPVPCDGPQAGPFVNGGAAPSGSPATRLPGGAAVLVVDAEPGMRDFLAKALRPRCALVETAASTESAEALRRRYHFDLLVVDVRLPGRSGLEWVVALREEGVRTEVVVTTACADLDTAVTALRAGAADFLLKPFRPEQMLSAFERCMAQRHAERENFELGRGTRHAPAGARLIGGDPAIEEIRELVARVAPTSATVLVEGETGTGKELVARSIHEHSGRPGPFVAVNCASIPGELIESELFGHVRGAFTGAHQSRGGLFSHAYRGTLFLDEITELAPPMQSKLLRVLEERAVRPVGADRETPVDARVIAATNRGLAPAVRAGRFREDLYYRLNVIAIAIPPLRERLGDLPVLVEHLSRAVCAELEMAPPPVTHADVERLGTYAWPGNVRELRNVIERSCLLGRLPAQWVPPAGEVRPQGEVMPPVEWPLARVEKEHMLRVLEHCGGNKSRAARLLGISRKTMERRIRLWSG